MQQSELPQALDGSSDVLAKFVGTSAVDLSDLYADLLGSSPPSQSFDIARAEALSEAAQFSVGS